MSFFKKHKYIKRVLLGLLYLLVSLVVLELTLQLAGYCYGAYYVMKGDIKSDPNYCNIMLVGESTPNLMVEGIKRDDLFPALIEKNLSDKYRIRVYNKAVSGQTSSAIVRKLKEQLLRYRPKLVISLMGANDYSYYLNGLNYRLIAGKYLVPEFITNLKTYRLVTVIENLLDGHIKVINHSLIYNNVEGLKTNINPPNGMDRIQGEQLLSNYRALVDISRDYGASVLPITYLHEYESIKLILETLKSEKEVEYFDLSMSNVVTKHPDWFLSDKWHLSKLGHQKMAEFILEYFRENKTIEQTCAGYEK